MSNRVLRHLVCVCIILDSLFFPSILHAQGSAFVANQQQMAILPGNVRNVSLVDGEFYCYSAGVLLKAHRSGEQLLEFWPDTVFARLQENVEYVVRHPSGDIYLTARDKKGRSFLYQCINLGTKDEKMKQVRLDGGLFNKGMTVEHPTFSKDGRIIVFSSNEEKNSEGGYDLWYSLYDGEQWSKPENLGRRVNTGRDEMTPFIYQEYLLFSSNGRREDNGKMCVYSMRLISDHVTGDTVDMQHIGRSRVQRLPAPLNADNADDLDMAVDTISKCGYWVSLRKTFGNKSPLYSFSGTLDGMLVWGKVTDKSGRPLAGVNITARQGKSVVCNSVTDLDGRYSVYLVCDQRYGLTYQHDGFFSQIDSVNTVKSDEEYLIFESRRDVMLDRLPLGQRIYFEDLFGPDADVELSARGIERLAPLVQFLNDNPLLKVNMTLINALTDNGDFNLMLTDERIRTLEKYLYPLLPTTVEINIENGCIGRDGCSDASGVSRLTVLINK